MAVERVDAEAVVNHNRVSREVQLLGKNHFASLSRMDRSASRSRKVDAAVGRSWYPIQNTSLTKVTARGGDVQRFAEAAFPERLWGDLVENGAELFALSVGALGLLFVRFGELLGNLKTFRGEVTKRDSDGGFAGERSVVGGFSRQDEFVSAGGFFEVDAEEGLLTFGSTILPWACDPKWDFMAVPSAFDLC